jgi:hypothetical protein
MGIITILWALVSLCIAVGVIWLILWVISLLGLAIPANVVRIIWVILILLAIIFIAQHFFVGSSLGFDVHHR